MMKKQQGFTLIELVAVIVILGALAVVALPRFINLQDDAQLAATEGVAGAMASAAAVNYAGYLADDQTKDPNGNNAVELNNCTLTEFNTAMQQDVDSGDYSLADSGGGTGPGADAGTSFVCDLTGPGDDTVRFTAVAVS